MSKKFRHFSKRLGFRLETPDTSGRPGPGRWRTAASLLPAAAGTVPTVPRAPAPLDTVAFTIHPEGACRVPLAVRWRLLRKTPPPRAWPQAWPRRAGLALTVGCSVSSVLARQAPSAAAGLTAV